MIFRESTQTSERPDRRMWAPCSLKILRCMPRKRFTLVGRRSYPILTFLDINLVHSLLALCTISPQLLKQNDAAGNRFCFISCLGKKEKRCKHIWRARHPPSGHKRMTVKVGRLLKGLAVPHSTLCHTQQLGCSSVSSIGRQL